MRLQLILHQAAAKPAMGCRPKAIKIIATIGGKTTIAASAAAFANNSYQNNRWKN